jgi:hypothetical protein
MMTNYAQKDLRGLLPLPTSAEDPTRHARLPQYNVPTCPNHPFHNSSHPQSSQSHPDHCDRRTIGYSPESSCSQRARLYRSPARSCRSILAMDVHVDGWEAAAANGVMWQANRKASGTRMAPNPSYRRSRIQKRQARNSK